MTAGIRFARSDGGNAAVPTVVGVGVAQTGAAAITEPFNFLTSETGQTGFVLPASWPQGGMPIVCKVGTVAATIYPATGGTINGAAANAVFSATAAKMVTLYPLSDGSAVTNWFAVQGA